MLKSRGLFTCQVYSVEQIVSQFLTLQVRQLETKNMKMKRKKTLLEEYNNTDITKLRTSYEAEKQDLMTAIDELTQKYTDMKLTAEGLVQGK